MGGFALLLYSYISAVFVQALTSVNSGARSWQTLDDHAEGMNINATRLSRYLMV